MYLFIYLFIYHTT